MKKITIQIVLGFLMTGFTSASNTPETVVQDIISAIKGNKTHAIVDYVYWPSAFTRLTPSSKKHLRLKSPEEFRSLSYTFLKNPDRVIDSRLSEYKLTMLGGNSSPLAQPLDQLGEAFKKKVQEVKRNVKNAHYSIVNTEISSSTATVIVKSTLRGQSALNKVKLIFVNGKWLLSDLTPANSWISSLHTLPQFPQNLGL